MRALATGLIAGLTLLLACAPDPPPVLPKTLPSGSRETRPSSYAPAVRRACARAIGALHQITHGPLRLRDTLLDAGEPHAHLLACDVQTDSFPTAAGYGLLDGDITDNTVSWVPFWDDGMRPVALRTDSVRCDTTPFVATRRPVAFFRRYASFQIRCYPVEPSPRLTDER